jgi:hypothetical protein
VRLLLIKKLVSSVRKAIELQKRKMIVDSGMEVIKNSMAPHLIATSRAAEDTALLKVSQ